MPLKPETSGELRSMVRALLRETLAQRPSPSGGIETVRIANDGELAGFVARLMEPATLDAVRSGKLRFTLQSQATPAPASPSAGTLDGVITEQKIERLAGSSVLILGPGAVLTPLARDKVRKLGLRIERRR